MKIFLKLQRQAISKKGKGTIKPLQLVRMKIKKQMNCVFDTNQIFPIPVYMQPDGVNF